ncbi:hypothetical protein [Nesterenkonia ebinurensis]|uniref:hypothetical protein n=1 Tax=Nesterenkonia ebinurensis TaxID=2608252 RepID=UPI00123CA43D|nr:hypothetical protein [Nesterenkonia ebinurensis]
MTLTVCEPLVDEQIALPCDYPKWWQWLNADHSHAEDCDNAAEFVIIHHDCREPNIKGKHHRVILVCANT